MPSTDAAPAELLEWDSEFWGFNVGRASGQEMNSEVAGAVDAWAASNDVACVYLHVPSEDQASISAAEDAGFRLVEIRVAFVFPKKPAGAYRLKPDAETKVRWSRPEDLAELRRIAGDSYHDSRFYVDPNFPRDRCDELYATWIERSLAGYQGDRVLIVEIGGRAAGFVTLADEGAGVGRVSLVAIDPDLRGGTASARASNALANAMVEWAVEGGLSVRAFSQGRNMRAVKYIQYVGFVIVGHSLYFHKWYR